MAVVYSTTTKLKARFENDEAVAHLTDTGEKGEPNEAVLTEVLEDAEGEMNSYIGVRYLIPVVVANDAIMASRLDSVALDLAVYKLLGRGDIASDVKTKSFDDAIAWLKMVAKGEVVLPAAATQAGTESREIHAAIGTGVGGTPPKRVFTRRSQLGL